jgi:hypothetical protein
VLSVSQASPTRTAVATSSAGHQAFTRDSRPVLRFRGDRLRDGARFAARPFDGRRRGARPRAV